MHVPGSMICTEIDLKNDTAVAHDTAVVVVTVLYLFPSEGQVRQAVCLFLMRCIILKAQVSSVPPTAVGWLVG